MNTMTATDIRINARLTGPDATRFRALLGQSGRSASDLLRDALREYQTHRLAPKRNAADLLADFVGAGEGPEDLSLNYKMYLTEGLSHKLRGYVQDCDDSGR